MSRRRSFETIQKSEYITISELVLLSGLRYSTLKYYTEEGMLPFHQEDIRMTRRYRRVATLERIKEIQSLKEKGLTIREIKEKLSSDSGEKSD
ncbi:MerR family transcriptional regulator [Kroppenstedtia guangzhouensis]|jgi:DNA-binding transcriptional MerR regulator|uniref:MerR family transcriptional regulator n=1 Tax=Kroppenstedtia guangzhouensis TaxID=1274356 RepID=A0ABQ1H470_9BACL|nr:helix-turn-helix domain-containing protein [Kroppenstedtia guangzhouensis]GGA56895.1 MerR family transcriptional regulator [Kroppenstedtia guangzhouensis]